MNIQEARQALDKLIAKARIHLYKPIQIAEILYRDRTAGDIDLSDVETYRTPSRKWRDKVCLRFLGRTSTSSARYQDDVFNANAIPPSVMTVLGMVNRQGDGIVEAYIYQCFAHRFAQMSSGLEYCNTHDRNSFQVKEFIDLFWNQPGLRRSIDKIYEIIVYALFSALVESMDVKITIEANAQKSDLLNEFSDFARQVMGLTAEKPKTTINARINRAGVTNAADRGLDMWANFGMAIQIKHLSLTEELAENITSSVSSDRIVIVCKDSEEKVILSLLNQIGWRARIQSIITESNLIGWYEKALRGNYAHITGDKILSILSHEIQIEFPASHSSDMEVFRKSRGYDKITPNQPWQTKI